VEVSQRFDVRRLALEEKGLRINRSKTEYIEYKCEEKEQIDTMRSRIIIDGDEIKEVECFKYLWSFVQKNGGFNEVVSIGLGVSGSNG